MRGFKKIKKFNMHQNCINFGQKGSPAIKNVPQALLGVLAVFFSSVEDGCKTVREGTQAPWNSLTRESSLFGTV